MALDLCLSLVHTGVSAMGQDYNYQLEFTELGRNSRKTIQLLFHVLLNAITPTYEMFRYPILA
jgi:hypothetical protein